MAQDENQIAVQDCWLGKRETSLKTLQSTFEVPNLSNTIRPRTGISIAGHNAGGLTSSKRSGAQLDDVHVFCLLTDSTDNPVQKLGPSLPWSSY